jgi:hypothetical protein
MYLPVCETGGVNWDMYSKRNENNKEDKEKKVNDE